MPDSEEPSNDTPERTGFTEPSEPADPGPRSEGRDSQGAAFMVGGTVRVDMDALGEAGTVYQIGSPIYQEGRVVGVVRALYPEARTLDLSLHAGEAFYPRLYEHPLGTQPQSPPTPGPISMGSLPLSIPLTHRPLVGFTRLQDDTPTEDDTAQEEEEALYSQVQEALEELDYYMGSMDYTAAVRVTEAVLDNLRALARGDTETTTSTTLTADAPSVADDPKDVSTLWDFINEDE